MTPPDHIAFQSPSTLSAPAGYSQIVTVTGGKLVYIAGQVALDMSGRLVGRDDFQAQARQIFENLKAALAAVGADFSHVVKLNYYLLDRANLPLLRDVRDQYVNVQSPPASTLVEVRNLALDGLLLEIEAVASLPA